MRNYRLEAELSSRETDNRNPEDMIGWRATIVLPSRKPTRAAVKDSMRRMEGHA